MINIKTIRNYMRSKLITAAIIPTADYAWEGRYFDPAQKEIYVAEVIQPDNDLKAATTKYGSQITFTYNVYSRAGDAGGNTNTEESYTVLHGIADTFAADKPTEISGDDVVTINTIRRRVATENDGWRLSPIDITVRVEKPI